jgi:hypothetical protein
MTLRGDRISQFLRVWGDRTGFAIINISSVSEMIAMSDVAEQILQTVEALPVEDQQQVLDFVEFLWAKRQRARTTEPETALRSSFFEVAQASIGAGEGPGDLSTNPDYMQDYGQ